MEIMSTKVKLKLIDDLEQQKFPFRTFWEISDIYFTNNGPVKTAAVEFSHGKIKLIFNLDYWNNISEIQRLFVICHEQLHLLLDHFNRLDFKDGDVYNKNIAADIAVNHMLIRNYNFELTDLDDWKKYCWVETVFQNQIVSDNETALYYYALIQRELDKQGLSGNLSIDSSTLEDGLTEIPSDIKKELKEVIQKHIEEEIADLPEELQDQIVSEYYERFDINYNQTGFGNGQQVHDLTPKPSAAKWITVYKKILKLHVTYKTQHHWKNKPRNLQALPDDMLLPCNDDVETYGKVNVGVYLDSSGSCVSHAQHFLNTALTLPSSLFDVTYFGFGTKVYPIPKKRPYTLKGFGNESYQAVSDHVDNFKGGLDVVFVFTDGNSRPIVPKEPKKWHWFITPHGTTSTIDSRCFLYNLQDLGWTGH